MNEVVSEGDLPGRRRTVKVKELEDKIKKLENENKKLLTKVHTSSPPPERDYSRSKALSTNPGFQNGSCDDADDLESGLLDIKTLLNEEDFREDEWLYVSPKLPPTPVQKKVPPLQWLSEGHNKGGKATEGLPSLDDVRKSLIYNIDEAENLGDVPGYSSNSKRRRAAANKPAQDTRTRNKSPSLDKPNSTQSEAVLPVVKREAGHPPATNPSSSEPLEEEPVPSRKWKVKQVPPTTAELPADGDAEEIVPQSNGTLAQQVRQGREEEVPVVKWKAKMPSDETPSDVPVVKWKARVPQENSAADVKKRANMPPETQGSDVPVVKWKARMPEDHDVPLVRGKAKMPEDSDVPVVKWKAKMPEDAQRTDVPSVKRKAADTHNSDVPVVKWKAKVPEDSDVPVVKWKAKMPEDSDVPVVKWKAKVPEDSDVPVVKWKAKMPEDAQRSDVPSVKRKAVDTQNSDVPVVKWKAKMPEDGQASSNAVIRKKVKMPEDHQVPDVPVVKWKAKMPQGDNVPVVKWKASNPIGSAENVASTQEQKHSLSPKVVSSPRTVPVSTTSESAQALPSTSHQTTMATSSLPNLTHSPVVSSSQLSENEPAPKSLSRRSSFSDSRSPSPPSIAPHVRMAIASPILSRRTPSPSRGSLGSLNSRQSPGASPVLQQKHLQYLSGAGGGQSPATARAFAGVPPPGGHASRIRTPRGQPQQQQAGAVVKTSAPLKGLTPPGERKHKRMLPSGLPPAGRPQDQGGSGGSRSNQGTPTSNRWPTQQASPGQDTGDDDDSWLEGCF